MIDQDYMVNVDAYPRASILPPHNLHEIKWRKVWLFRKSNFKDWKIDD